MWHPNRYLQRLILFFALLLICITCFADVASGLLWRIHKPQHPANYLFGTIHVDDKRVKQLNKNIRHRFDDAKTLCLEILPDKKTQVAIGLAMLLPENQRLDDMLGKALYSRVSLEMTKKGISPLYTIRLKPWAAMMVLSRPVSQGGYALDEQLYHWGKSLNKNLCALEHLSEQLSIFDQLSVQDQISILSDTLADESELEVVTEKLIQAYLSGDLAEIYLQSLEMEGSNTELALSLRERLIDHRNIKMAERLVTTLDQGNAFIAVGALHLPGKHGLLQLLTEKGFIVTLSSIAINP
jgi:uncharacterized protein YbaP (TraB family)